MSKRPSAVGDTGAAPCDDHLNSSTPSSLHPLRRSSCYSTSCTCIALDCSQPLRRARQTHTGLPFQWWYSCAWVGTFVLCHARLRIASLVFACRRHEGDHDNITTSRGLKVSWGFVLHHRRDVVCDTKAAGRDVRLNSISPAVCLSIVAVHVIPHLAHALLPLARSH